MRRLRRPNLTRKLLSNLIALYGASVIAAAGQVLKEGDVVELANRAAKKEGYDLSKFEKPEVHYEFTKKDKTWAVFYEGKLNKQGNSPIGAHFLVRVHDRTKETQVVEGR